MFHEKGVGILPVAVQLLSLGRGYSPHRKICVGVEGKCELSLFPGPRPTKPEERAMGWFVLC